MLISVVICTHNPKARYLNRVLDALRGQTLPADQWELLLIDNASSEPVADQFDLTWHPLGRHVHEPTTGLTPARLRAIAEVRADTIVFVDDDNILDSTYLAAAADVAARHPYLGAWGGVLDPEFEVPPADWTRPYQQFIGIRPVGRPVWAQAPLSVNPAIPYGAGLCVRTAVAREYAKRCETSSARRALGRAGQALNSGEDVDLALCACDLGLGTGLFPELRLTHLMPPERFTLDYLTRIVEGTSFSMAVLRYIREGDVPAPPPRAGPVRRLKNFVRRFRRPQPVWVIGAAADRGRDRARAAISQMNGKA